MLSFTVSPGPRVLLQPRMDSYGKRVLHCFCQWLPCMFYSVMLPTVVFLNLSFLFVAGTQRYCWFLCVECVSRVLINKLTCWMWSLFCECLIWCAWLSMSSVFTPLGSWSCL